MSYLAALEIVLGTEGGFSDHPADRGRSTMMGVTQSTYNRWRDKQRQAHRPVKEIEHEELVSLYHTEYWLPVCGDDLPRAVAVAVFDCSVNSGPTQAIKLLQRALRVKQDGIFGPMTQNAARNAAPQKLLFDFGNERSDFISDIITADQSQLVFLKGWIRRIRQLEQGLLLRVGPPLAVSEL